LISVLPRKSCFDVGPAFIWATTASIGIAMRRKNGGFGSRTSCCQLLTAERLPHSLASLEATNPPASSSARDADYPDTSRAALHTRCKAAVTACSPRRMRRRWGSQRFIDRLPPVRSGWTDPRSSTDIIAGFPGETKPSSRTSPLPASLLQNSHLPFSPPPRHPGGPRRAEPGAKALHQNARAN